MQSRVPAIIETLENRQLLTATTLFSDQFNSPNSNDINANVHSATRQSGVLAGATYTESAATQSGGTLDYLSQVNNGSRANSLLLGVQPSAGLTDNSASPNLDFGNSRYGFSHVEVTVTPHGPSTVGNAVVDHWAALEFGAAAGTLLTSAGTGVEIELNGQWHLYNNGVSVASGSVPTAKSYTLAFDVTPGTGLYTLSINGNSVYSGNHGSAYSTNYVSLEDHSSQGAIGYQLDYFGNLLVSGQSAPTNLLTDSFATSGNSFDINNQVATRQSGVFAGTTFTEPALSGNGGSATYLTQVSNGGLTGTMLMATSPQQKYTYATPNANLFDPKLAVNNVSINITPLGSGTNDTSFADHWAGIALGGSAGAFVAQKGVSGLLIRANGSFAVFENGVQVAIGGVVATRTYGVNYAINPQNGSYQVSINGLTVYSGTHGTPYGLKDRITLEDNTTGATTGLQVDYMDNLKITGFASPFVTAANTTFYISPTGNDANDGLSALTPWQTLDRVNEEYIRSGDQFLFKGGSTFTGTLQLSSKDSGISGAPVVLSSYGTGTARISAIAGNAINLIDTQYVTISNLTLVGPGYSVDATSDGIDIVNDLNTSLSGITITGVDSSGFGDSGVKFIGAFDNVSIINCALHDNGNGGLWMNSGSYASRNVYIGHVVANNNAGSPTTTGSGYGIFVQNVRDGVIEHSTALNNGWLVGNIGLTGGIEAISDDRVLLQYNEAGFNHHGGADGDGIILDSSTNSILQYNYTHDNDGGGLFMGAETGAVSDNNVIRYNISQNDARAGSSYGGIHIWQDVNNTEIYDNTIYMSPGSGNVYAAVVAIVGFSGTNIEFRNNIFEVAGALPIILYFGGGSGIIFQGNDYWSTGSLFEINWNGKNYLSLSSFQSGTGQEGGTTASTGFQVNPGLVAPGTGGTIGDATNLTTLTAYEVSIASVLRNRGQDLSKYSYIWDHDSFAIDSFMSPYFNTTPEDFYGNVLPAWSSGKLSLGADQLT